jgi:hypothetical protein
MLGCKNNIRICQFFYFFHFWKDKDLQSHSFTNWKVTIIQKERFKLHTHTSHLSDCAPLPISLVSRSSQESSSTYSNLGLNILKHLRAVLSLLGQPLQY